MKRLSFLTLCLLFIPITVFCESGWQGDYAWDIKTDTFYFNNKLSSADDDVQKALETLDEITESDPLAVLATGTRTGATSQSQPFTNGVTLSNMTLGSVLFAGTAGVVSQDNANFFWDNVNKRLGIGTASPSSPLHVVGTAFPAVTLQLNAAGTGVVASAVRLFRNNTTPLANDSTGFVFSLLDSANNITNYARVTGVSTVITDGAEEGALTFDVGTSLTEKMRITNSGNVGIGTTDLDGTPAIGRITVKGTTNDGSTNIFVGRDSDEANVISVDTNGNVIIASNGFYDIGTSQTSPAYRLAGSNVLSLVSGILNINAGGYARTDINGDVTFKTGAIDAGGSTSFEIPNAANPTLGTTGQIAINTTDKTLELNNGTAQVAMPTIRIAQGTFDLKAQYAVDPDFWLVDLDADSYPHGIYITKIYVDASVADPTNELNANLNYCDAVGTGAFPGANATLIKAIDTTTGNFADPAVNTAVPTGKTIYITMDVDPTDANVQYHIKIHYYIPTS